MLKNKCDKITNFSKKVEILDLYLEIASKDKKNENIL